MQRISEQNDTRFTETSNNYNHKDITPTHTSVCLRKKEH